MEKNEARLVLKYEMAKQAAKDHQLSAEYWQEIAINQQKINIDLEESINDLLNDMNKLMLAMYGVFIIISMALIYQFSTM